MGKGLNLRRPAVLALRRRPAVLSLRMEMAELRPRRTGTTPAEHADGDGAVDGESEMKPQRTGEVTGYALGGEGNDHASWPKSGSTRTAKSGVQPGPGSNCTDRQPKSGPSPLAGNQTGQK